MKGEFIPADDTADFAFRVAETVVQRLESKLNQASPESPVGREKMAGLLGVSVPTIDRMVRDGEIPSLRIKKRRVFIPAQVYEALQDRAA